MVTNPMLIGMGTTIPRLQQMIAHDSDALSLLGQAWRRPVGTNQHTEGVHIMNGLSRPHGDSKAYALQKLSDEGQVALLDQVKAGKLSANQAMKKALNC